MKSTKGVKPRIVVKIIRQDDSQPSGVWKIAYADFVTAMMAFFLLMWLISSSTQTELQQIAEYFSTPLSVALFGGKSPEMTSSPISVKGGSGTDIKKTRGQTAKTEMNLESAEMIIKKQEMKRLEQLKQSLEKVIDSNPEMKKFRKQLLIDITAQGLRIQIVDQQNRPMFALGSAVLQPYAEEILHEIGRTLNEVPYKISLSGHTDATPYQGSAKNYNNWDLSLDRANASRRALVAGGMNPDKVLRVIGLASAVPINRKDPYDPINRRISIIVMNTEAAEHAALESK